MSRREPPGASVIVLNFNGEAILRRCLEALAAQTCGDFEVIVVDNASTDGSEVILKEFEDRDTRFRIVRSPSNRGVAGGRNLGIQAARGEFIAFIDNDGFARPDWLEQCLATFADQEVGAVASLVFFARKKMVLNGAGGTLNLRGYGGDHCFRSSYEFARIPHDVLYPMGCGMVIRRTVLDEIGPFDERIFNYYDDVELGIATWNAGYRVRVCPGAWIDHVYGSSTSTNREKVFLCERNRIRTVLKFFPRRRLPVWLLRELEGLRYLRMSGLRSIPLLAWLWNLVHLPSLVSQRRRRRPDPNRYWGLIAQTWDTYPQILPEEHVSSADLTRAGDGAKVGTQEDPPHLLFGWYPPEIDGEGPFRWAAPEASLVIRTTDRSDRLRLALRSVRPGQRVEVILRPLGSLKVLFRYDLRPSSQWEESNLPLHLEAGDYELLLRSRPIVHDHTGRSLGAGVKSFKMSAATSSRGAAAAGS